jgi:ATP-dependent Clp protease ATP-binding subunit ClpC
MFERFTDGARRVMALANEETRRFGHECMGTEHILLGLLKEGSGVGATVLANLGMDVEKFRSEIEGLANSGRGTATREAGPSVGARRVIEYAIEEARSLNHKYIGTEHILLGLLRESEGVAALVLTNLGLKIEAVRDEVLEVLEERGKREN